MKKVVLIFLIVLSNCIYSKAQFFEWTQTIHSVWSIHSATLSTRTCTANYDGEIMSTLLSHPCLSCAHEMRVHKRNAAQNLSISYFDWPYSNERLMGDSAKNTYMFCNFNGNLQLTSGSVQVTCLGDTFALIKYNQTSTTAWYAKGLFKNFHIAYNGNVYLITNDSLQMLDTSGQLIWQRNTGGSFVFGDSDFNYYVRDSFSFNKYDSAGVLLWNLILPLNKKFAFDVMGNSLFMVSNDSIHKIETQTGLAITAVNNFANTTDLLFDSNGNYYSKGGHKFSFANGLEWNFSLPGTQTISIDKYDNLYFGFSVNSNTSHNIFIPPNTYLSSTGVWNGSASGVALAYKISSADSIANAIITTGNVAGLCVDNGVMDVPFTLNRYYVQYLNAGFSVELSDSTGSFANPYVIGTGNASPIRCTIPFFNVYANGYKIRVVSNTTPKVIGSQSGSLTAYQSPHINLVPSNQANSWISYCYPLSLTISPPGNYYCNWYNKQLINNAVFVPIFSNNGPAIAVSSSNAPNINTTFYVYKVEALDNVSGCLSTGYSDMIKLYSGVDTPRIRFPNTICINDGPILLEQLTLTGEYSGTGINGLYFYPDSAGYGTHVITFTSYDTVSCHPLSWSKNVFVDSCINPLVTHSVNNNEKTKFCVGDTLIVDFSYDSTVIAPGTWFYLYSQYGYEIDSTQTSPFYTVLTSTMNINYAPASFRLMVKTKTPVITGTLNYGEPIQVFKEPVITSFTANAQQVSCVNGGNVLLNIKAPGYIYRWHHDNTFVDDTTSFTSGGLFQNNYYGTESSYLATSNGYYWVEIFNEGGCQTISDSIFIADSSQYVNYQLSVSPNPFCAGDSAALLLTTDTNNIATWTYGGNPYNPSNPFNFATSDTGTYTVEVNNIYRCKRKQSVSLYKITPTIPVITSTRGSFRICTGDSIRLRLTSWYNNLLWYKNGILFPGGTAQYSNYISDSGYYYATANYSICPVESDSVQIYIEDKPIPVITTDSIFSCNINIPVSLQAIALNATPSCLWSLNYGNFVVQTAATLTNQLNMVYAFQAVPGIYTLWVSDAYCMSEVQDSVYVGVYNMPNSNIFTNDTTAFCIGDSAALHSLNLVGENYQWFNDTVLLTSGAVTSLPVFAAGNYYVITTDSFCVDTSNVIIITTPCATGIDDVYARATKIEVLPNPASEKIMVKFLTQIGGVNASVNIYNAQQKLISTSQCSTECGLDISKLPPSIYYLRVLTQTEIFVAKFIKQ